jgi:NADH-quinone oxidoreductase subunit N
VPPLIGFFAKLFLLQSALLAGYAWLVLLALVTSVIGAVAAARLLRLMFVDLPDEGEAPVPSAGGGVRIAIGVCALVTVLLGVAAQPLFNLASGGAGSIH